MQFGNYLASQPAGLSSQTSNAKAKGRLMMAAIKACSHTWNILLVANVKDIRVR